MHDLLPTIAAWQGQGKAIALATLVQRYGSSPRLLGSQMVISEVGEMMGSVSGGCVEGAVAQAGLAVLQSGQPRLVTYGIADELAHSVGLACGGEIQVFVTRLMDAHLTGFQTNEPIALVTVLTGDQAGNLMLVRSTGQRLGQLASPELTDQALAGALDALRQGKPVRLSLPTEHEPLELFIHVQQPAPRLIIVGAVQIAIPLVTFARELGFHTVVIDARSAFLTPERFGHADQLIRQWPADALAELALDQATWVVFLSHDEKQDNPALVQVLRQPVAYVGALGAPRTHARRVAALREMGLTQEQIDRIHAPIGLELGGRTPAEIALAVMAQVVKIQNQQRKL